MCIQGNTPEEGQRDHSTKDSNRGSGKYLGRKISSPGKQFSQGGWDLTFLCILASVLYLTSQTAVRQAKAVYYSRFPDRVLRMLLDAATKMSWDVAPDKGWVWEHFPVVLFIFSNMKPQINLYLLHQPQVENAVIFLFFNLLFQCQGLYYILP